MTPIELKKPRLLPSAAATRRSVALADFPRHGIGVEKRIREPRQPGLALCLAQSQTQVTADQRVVFWHQLRKVECPREVPDRIIGGQGG